jgi:hypothetical protein
MKEGAKQSWRDRGGNSSTPCRCSAHSENPTSSSARWLMATGLLILAGVAGRWLTPTPISRKRVDLLDTTLVTRTVEDRGRQWNAEKPYRS